MSQERIIQYIGGGGTYCILLTSVYTYMISPEGRRYNFKLRCKRARGALLDFSDPGRILQRERKNEPADPSGPAQ